jgi:MATE family multidrug resistance protein
MRNGMVLALAVFLLVAWALQGPLGNHGLWLAMLAFMAARGLWLGLVYLHIERGAGFVAALGGSVPARR